VQTGQRCMSMSHPPIGMTRCDSFPRNGSGRGWGARRELLDNLRSDAGCNPQPPRRSGNSSAPTVATGPQSVKRGENRIEPESDGPLTGSRVAMGSHATIRHHPSLSRPGQRGLGLPKTGLVEVGGRSSSPTPLRLTTAERMTLRLHITDRRNEGTGVLLSTVVDTRRRRQPHGHAGRIA